MQQGVVGRGDHQRRADAVQPGLDAEARAFLLRQRFDPQTLGFGDHGRVARDHGDPSGAGGAQGAHHPRQQGLALELDQRLVRRVGVDRDRIVGAAGAGQDQGVEPRHARAFRYSR